jgi:hypothetical protein
MLEQNFFGELQALFVVYASFLYRCTRNVLSVSGPDCEFVIFLSLKKRTCIPDPNVDPDSVTGSETLITNRHFLELSS